MQGYYATPHTQPTRQLPVLSSCAATALCTLNILLMKYIPRKITDVSWNQLGIMIKAMINQQLLCSLYSTESVNCFT